MGSWSDTSQKLQRATRFFAYLESFTLECPHCGIVYQIRKGLSKGIWDPRLSRFRCSGKGGCGFRYILGLLAWPIAGGGNVARQPPDDQVPGPRQLAQLRKEGGGWWLADSAAQRFRRPLETNLTGEEQRPPLDSDEED